MRRTKRIKAAETLATRGRKVSIKSHSRRTRGGKRVVVRSYSRHAGGKTKRPKTKESSGSEFEKLKNQSPYGEPRTKRLHTFQGSDEDTDFAFRRVMGDKLTESKRKVKEYLSKGKELNKVERGLDKFLCKYGYSYKKYV